MIVRNTQEPRSDIESLIKQALDASEAIHVTGRAGRVVVISEADWRAITETLHLQSIPGMVESIHSAAAEPVEACEEWPSDDVADRPDKPGVLRMWTHYE